MSLSRFCALFPLSGPLAPPCCEAGAACAQIPDGYNRATSPPTTERHTHLTDFSDLGLAAPILEMLAAEQYTRPTPIQAQAIPHVLAGRDLLGIAQTGTGKTAAFALPILQRLDAQRRPAPRRGCRVLVLAPTRELASQIADAFRTYGRGIGVYLGSSVRRCRRNPQIRKHGARRRHAGGDAGAVARSSCNRATFACDGVEVIVLDEADRMLDMGFIRPSAASLPPRPRAARRCCSQQRCRPTSRKLATDLLDDPVKVAVTPVASTVELIDQRVLHVAAREKRALLASLLKDRAMPVHWCSPGRSAAPTGSPGTWLRPASPPTAIHGNKIAGPATAGAGRLPLGPHAACW